MRISDWSSDVCSSDLVAVRGAGPGRSRPGADRLARRGPGLGSHPGARRRAGHGATAHGIAGVRGPTGGRDRAARRRRGAGSRDRKSVVEGKRVAVRVDLGGRRSLKKKKKTEYI